MKTNHWFILVFLFLIVFGVFTVAAHTVFQGNTPGLDYYIFWSAGRAFYAHQDPYSPELGEQIQIGMSGNMTDAKRDKMIFANPPYALLILFPFIWLDFGWSQAAWMSFSILLVLTTAYLVFPKAPVWITLSFPFLYPFVFGYVMGNFVVIIAVILLIFLRCLLDSAPPKRNTQVVLGLLMAWATVKPQFIWAMMLLFFIYILRQRLWTMLASFFSSLVVMSLVSVFIRPDCLVKWFGQLGVYNQQNNDPSLLNQFLSIALPGPAVTAAFTTIIVTFAGISLYLIFRWWNGKMDPLLLVTWLSFITAVVHPNGRGGVSYEELIFLVPFFVWAARMKPAPLIAIVWFTGWLLSYLLNTSLLITNTIGMSPYFLLSFMIWMIWLFIRSSRLPGLMERGAV